MPTTALSAPVQSAAPETLSLNGSVSYLKYVGFAGNIEGTIFKAPRDGSQCIGGAAGYSDIAPGVAVQITTGTGDLVATAPLKRGKSKTTVRGTDGERRMRRDLIDSIFDLRMAKTLNAVEDSRLNLLRAKQHVYDLKHPRELKFEGRPFYAVYCSLAFNADSLPLADTYTIQVANRASTVVTAVKLVRNDGRLDLFFDN